MPCQGVKKFLAERGIAYTEIDVAADREAMEELRRISGALSVPVVTIDGAVTVGFEKKRLAELLAEEDA